MSVVTLALKLMTIRMRAQKKLRFLTFGSSIMVVSMMFYFTQTKAAQLSPSPDVVEFSAWRILAGLTFTIMAMGLSEMGSDSEQEFLATLGLQGWAYIWAKWMDLGVRSLPWFLWGASWAVATASAIPGRPFLILLGLAFSLFLFGLTAGGALGFGLEMLLRKLKNGQQTSKAVAMFAPFVLVMAMMGMGQNIPVPPILHALGWFTPIGHYMGILYNQSDVLLSVLGSLSTVLPWILVMGFIGLVWSFRREARGFFLGLRDQGTHETAVRFTNTPFVVKDLVMLRRYRFTLFRGVIAAVFLLFPFTFMNTQTDMPLFLKFFEIMIVVAASGMMFGLLLPAMDREVLWLVRITGRLRTYMLQKHALVSALTLLFSAVIILPLTLTLHLSAAVVVPLTLVGSALMAGLSLIGSGIATKMGIDMVSRPDANIVMGIMFAFGFYLASTVLGYMVSWLLFVGFLAFWCVVSVAALGVALYIFETLELE